MYNCNNLECIRACVCGVVTCQKACVCGVVTCQNACVWCGVVTCQNADASACVWSNTYENQIDFPNSLFLSLM